MKKFIPVLAAALVSCSAVCMNAYAEDPASVVVNVTLSDGNGSPELIQQPITVTDADKDGKLTINDALYLTHENYFNGGADAGYKTSVSTYGLKIDRLWGIENGGGYGFYLNNGFSMGLSDPVADGDYLYAYVYSDTATWSDTYSWFDKNNASVEQGDEMELTLSCMKFDASGSPVASPVADAAITINDNATEYKTDANGKVTVKIPEAGRSLISAKSDSINLVPPVLVVNASASQGTTTTSETTTTSSETSATETTTASDTTSTSSSTTSTTTAKSTTTTAKSGGSSKNDSPKTGDMGAGTAVFFLGTAVCTAFALRKKNEK